MAHRHGTVIVFKEGVSRDEAAHALSSIKEFIDLDQRVQSENEWATINNMIEPFDPAWGFPVFYIP